MLDSAEVGRWQGPRHRLTYRILGEGPPLVLIPGIASTYRVYALLLNRLGEHFRTILFDYPGEDPDDGARLVLVEFSDFQCPYCGRHVKQTMPQIERDYVATGKLRYVVRNLPLEQIHPDALRAAEAAECAGDQGKYWEMHERLFGHQQALAAPDLVRYAQEAGAEPAAFQRCLEAAPHQAKIRQDLADAQAAGITGTPTFFLGFADGTGKVKVARRISGAQPYPVFKGAIDALLAEGPRK